jgi:hypothetical protein
MNMDVIKRIPEESCAREVGLLLLRWGVIALSIAVILSARTHCGL